MAATADFFLSLQSSASGVLYNARFSKLHVQHLYSRARMLLLYYAGTSALSAAKTASSARFPRKWGATFATGSSLLMKPFYRRNCAYTSKSVPIGCEQSNVVDVWLGRLPMVGFASGISLEISTGKGLLENSGVATPLPTVALAVAALVGILTAVFIFQSASER